MENDPTFGAQMDHLTGIMGNKEDAAMAIMFSDDFEAYTPDIGAQWKDRFDRAMQFITDNRPVFNEYKVVIAVAEQFETRLNGFYADIQTNAGMTFATNGVGTGGINPADVSGRIPQLRRSRSPAGSSASPGAERRGRGVNNSGSAVKGFFQAI